MAKHAGPGSAEEVIRSLARARGAHLPSMLARLPPSRSVNPALWDSTVHFWRAVLREACVARGFGLESRYMLEARTIRAALSVDGIPPRDFPRILAELKGEGEIATIDEFVSEPRPRGVLGVLTAPLWWSLAALGVYSSAAQEPIHEGTFVLCERVEADLERITKLVASNLPLLDSIMTLDELLARLALPIRAGSKDADMLIHRACASRLLAYDPASHLVKLARLAPTRSSPVPQLTELDRQLHLLKSTAAKVEAQIVQLDKKIDIILEEARKHVREKRRPDATRCLARKKQLDTIRTKRTSSLDTLDQILTRIDAADSDVAVMGAYEAGTAALRNLLSKPELQLDNIDKVMDAVAETLADQNEIDKAVEANNKMVEAVSDVDEADLEAELEALVRESVAGAPTPPVTSPLPQEKVDTYIGAIAEQDEEVVDDTPPGRQRESTVDERLPPPKRKRVDDGARVMLAE